MEASKPIAVDDAGADGSAEGHYSNSVYFIETNVLMFNEGNQRHTTS